MVQPVATEDADDLQCPVCDYALRGLPEPRCPECGYAFEWAELRERARRRQLWFYEHAGTVRSHLLTRWKSLRPWSFWTQIHAYSDTDATRLRKYRWTTLLLLVAVFVGTLGLPTLQVLVVQALPRGQVIQTANPPPGARWIGYPNGSTFPPTHRSLTTRPAGGSGVRLPSFTQSTIAPYYVPPPAWAEWLRYWLTPSRYGASYGYGRRDGPSAGMLATMALLTVGVMLGLPLYWRLLRASVLQANIRPLHLARVDAYSSDVVPILLALATVAEMGWAMLPYWVRFEGTFGSIATHHLLAPAIIVGGLTLRLASALRRYVRFPQAVPVALGFGVIAVLAWMIVVIDVQ